MVSRGSLIYCDCRYFLLRLKYGSSSCLEIRRVIDLELTIGCTVFHKVVRQGQREAYLHIFVNMVFPDQANFAAERVTFLFFPFLQMKKLKVTSEPNDFY